ncbi:MAG: MFS transporter [Dehalococcoidia bacterium]|nr:MFS transporter [Dehalococcoidia bacterium]
MQAAQVLSGRRKIFYGWWLLAASVGAMALGSGVSFWAFGLYIEPLEAQFGWSRAQVSLGFSAALLVSGISGPLVGRWVDVRGPRSAIIIGAILTSLSYLLLATTDSLWQWYVYSSINAVLRQMMFFIPFMALISRWFDRRRGIATSILGTGFSLGGFVVVPWIRLAIDALGWQASFVASGALVAVVFLPIALFVIRNSPAEGGLLPDGATQIEGAPVKIPEVGMTLRETLRSPLFWVLACGFMSFFFGMFGWLVHQVPFYESVGISRGWAAFILSAAAGASIVTRLIAGVLADRTGRLELVVMALALVLIAAMVTLSISTSTTAIVLFVGLWIVGTAGGPMMEALILTRAFGVTHFATILGAVVVVETIGQILSPTITGAIYDATGTYDLALLLFIGTFSAAFVLFAIASRMPHPQAKRLAALAHARTSEAAG